MSSGTFFDIRTGVDSVEVVEIRSESESVNRSFEIFLDVRRRVCHFKLGFKYLKSTLGGHCETKVT